MDLPSVIIFLCLLVLICLAANLLLCAAEHVRDKRVVMAFCELAGAIVSLGGIYYTITGLTL